MALSHLCRTTLCRTSAYPAYGLLNASHPLFITKSNINVHQPENMHLTAEEIKRSKLTYREAAKEIIKDFPKESMKLMREIKDNYNKCLMPYFDIRHNDYEMIHRFDSQEAIDSWIVTSDKDNRHGTSSCDFVPTDYNTGIFQGFLSTRNEEGNPLKSTGYANISKKYEWTAFGRRKKTMDFSDYTHVLIRCRGDGRTYFLNVHMDREFDVQWDDMYSYPIYTRGGPYWQLEKIAFSKLVFSHHGRIQDLQENIDIRCIRNVSISIQETFNGPFSLELDFIALVHDANHKERTAYEKYQVDKSFMY